MITRETKKDKNGFLYNTYFIPLEDTPWYYCGLDPDEVDWIKSNTDRCWRCSHHKLFHVNGHCIVNECKCGQ